jgi:hypothetical protein
MFLKKFIQIWKDPVWSKVISFGIIAIISFVFALIKSKIEKTSIRQSINEILNFKISLIYILGVLLILYVIFFLFKRKKSKLSRAQYSIKKYNSETDEDRGIELKWDVEFLRNGKPYIENLKILCTKHGNIPLQFFNGKCPKEECENSKVEADYQKIHNHITSVLNYNWEKFNNQR